MNIDLTKLVTNMEEEIIINDSFELDKELFSKTSIRDLKDVKFEGTITKLCDGNYEIEGKISGIMILPDDITLEDVNYPFVSNVSEKFNETGKNEENNLEIIHNRLDIQEFLWQNILVEIPLKVKSEKSENLTLKGDGWRLVTEEELKESNNSPFSELSKIFDSRKE